MTAVGPHRNARQPDARRPRQLDALGDELDPRFSLSNEPMLLAWLRTSLALVVAEIAAVGLGEYHLSPARLSGALAALAFASGGAGAVAGLARWWRVEAALRREAYTVGRCRRGRRCGRPVRPCRCRRTAGALSEPWMPKGLQPERTSLAGRRTALAAVTATLALVRLMVGGSSRLTASAAVVLLVAVVPALALGRGAATHLRDRLATPYHPPSLTWLLCAAIPALALVGAASFLT